MSEYEGHYEEAVRRFFAIHEEDPRKVLRDGREVAWAVLYHDRMLSWLEKLAPEASEPLRLAAYCQHLRRWKIPRQNYPEGKLGYKKWRHDLAQLHGDEAAVVLEECGYGHDTIARVRELLLKADFKADPESQVLEDVVCLVFLENEFAAFAAKHEEEKLVTIVRKTWRKMSSRGQSEAQALAAGLPGGLQVLVKRAIDEP